MNIEPFEFKGKNYNLHIVSQENYSAYGNVFEQVKICKSEVITGQYEFMSYTALEDFDNFYGFFITNDDLNDIIVYSSLIIDTECGQTDDKITKLFNDYGLDELLEINIKECIEVTLLCSNDLKRVPGLTGAFFNYVIRNKIREINPDCKHILLSVASIETNTSAVDFYKKMGFRLLAPTIPKSTLMIYDYISGGKKRRTITRRTRRTRRTKRTRRRGRRTRQRKMRSKY